MQFRREAQSGRDRFPARILGGRRNSALTLADVYRTASAWRTAVKRQEDIRRLRQLLDGLPAAGDRSSAAVWAGRTAPLTQLETAGFAGTSAAATFPGWKPTRWNFCASGGCSGHKNSAEVNGFAPCSQLSRIFNCNSSSCSKVYSRFRCFHQFLFERRGGSPSAFKSSNLALGAAGLAGKPPLVQVGVGDLPPRRTRRRGTGLSAKGIPQRLQNDGIVHAPRPPAGPPCRAVPCAFPCRGWPERKPEPRSFLPTRLVM